MDGHALLRAGSDSNSWLGLVGIGIGMVVSDHEFLVVLHILAGVLVGMNLRAHTPDSDLITSTYTGDVMPIMIP